jgi:hypothetical protein
MRDDDDAYDRGMAVTMCLGDQVLYGHAVS